MPIAKRGDTVKVQYKASIEGNQVFNSSNFSPLEFTLGKEETIPAFEKAILGMATGENKIISVSSKEAFGPYREDLIMTVPRKELPSHIKFAPGQQFQMQQSNGTTNLVTVVFADDKRVTFDANHPLAGKDLTFDISLQEISKK
jgi:peptidylprolyl isomerase